MLGRCRTQISSPKTAIPSEYFLCFSSVSPRKCNNKISNYTAISSFQINYPTYNLTISGLSYWKSVVKHSADIITLTCPSYCALHVQLISFSLFLSTCVIITTVVCKNNAVQKPHRERIILKDVGCVAEITQLGGQVERVFFNRNVST